MQTVLVTGAAGFIGYHVCQRLAARGDAVVGVDAFNAYYEPALKSARADRLHDAGVPVHCLDVADADAMLDHVLTSNVSAVVHFAAQAGVRHSIDHPLEYGHSNLTGHLSVLEACRRAPKLRHLVYASSSSVYGDRPALGAAFRETDPVEHPVSLYAATKRACELMSQSYAHLYGIPQSGLRFFTVYGPWGRPDMAYFSFTRKILRGEPIEIYGDGLMQRDFTYVDDIVDGVVDVLDRPPQPGGHRIFNIGNTEPRALLDFLGLIESACGREAQRSFKPMQPGDVTSTWSDVSALHALTGYAPKISLEAGIGRFVDWYRVRYHDDGTLRS